MKSGLADSSVPAASVSFVTFSHPSLSPRFFQTALFKSLRKPGQQEAHGFVGGNLSDLDHDRLDRLTDHAARGGLPYGDLEPHLRGPAHPPAGGLNRQMKRQRSGRMADGEDRGLARLEVVTEVESSGGDRLPARALPVRARGRLPRQLGTRRSETQAAGRADRQRRLAWPRGTRRHV